MTAELERSLGALVTEIAFPRPAPDFAATVGRRIATEGARAGWGWRPIFGRRLRPALVLAVILLLVLAAIAAAIGLGVPGIRIVFGPVGSASPPPSAVIGPSPSSSPPTGGAIGAGMSLGTLTPFDSVETQVGFAPRLPAALGQPAAAYVQDKRLVMVWRPTRDQPTIAGTDVGLLVTEFRGRVDQGYYEKMIGSGSTVEQVKIGGHRGYWISGEPHALFYVDANGQSAFEDRRIVGQVLIWADDDLTYRLETGTSRDDAIALAESLR
jgi:hypothetical protein